MKSVAWFLSEQAKTRPDAPAIILPGQRQDDGSLQGEATSNASLDLLSDQIAAGLQSVGISRGMRTVLMVKPGLEFFALTFALFKAGVVPVMVDPGMGRANLGTCLKEAEPEAFIGIPVAQMARLLLGWGRGSIKHHVTVGRRWAWGGTTLDHVIAAGKEALEDQSTTPSVDVDTDETAAILFTSGSTGVPKGAVYSHGNFIAQVNIIRDTYGIEPGEIDLPTFPLFALFDPALGMTTVVPDMDFSNPGKVDPAMLVETVRGFNVTNMFGSPAVMDRLSRYGETHKVTFPSLRRVISAGAPVPGKTLARIEKMLAKDVEIFTPYGATEALPVASIGSHEILNEAQSLTDNGAGICVGRPVRGQTVRIIQISDEPIHAWQEVTETAKGEIGEITVQGPTVTRGYLHRPRSTKLAKIETDEGIVHRMGDLGYFDDKGRLWFCGRKNHRVVTQEETLFTINSEAVFNTHPKVRRTALVGVGNPMEAQAVLCIETEEPANRDEQTAIIADLQSIAKQHKHTRNIERFLFHPEFPVDVRHNSKIFREKLKIWAESQL